jgi:multiple sugar transport system ATP-binding protein
MIHVTHDQIEAMTLATRIAVMRGGKIQQFDTPDRVYAQPSNMFVAGFLGSPSMNFVRGQLRCHAAQVHFESASLKVDVSSYVFAQSPVDAQAAVLGIRPEHLRQVAPDTPHINARATVGLIEPMGAYKVGWLDAQGTPLAIQVEPQARLTSGAVIALALDTEHASLFDAASERRL